MLFCAFAMSSFFLLGADGLADRTKNHDRLTFLFF